MFSIHKNVFGVISFLYIFNLSNVISLGRNAYVDEELRSLKTKQQQIEGNSMVNTTELHYVYFASDLPTINSDIALLSIEIEENGRAYRR